MGRTRLDDSKVRCGRHGRRDGTLLCRHLLNRAQDLGFHWGTDPDAPDDPWPDAWCDRCEGFLERAGRWPDGPETADRFGLACAGCYELARAANWRQDDDAWRRVLDSAFAYLEAQQADLRERFRLDEYDRYHWDQGSGLLVFSNGDRPQVVAEVQFVGSVSKQGGTWLWSWANTSVEEKLRTAARQVRAYGEEQRFLRLAGAHWDGVEEDGWEMSAITAWLVGARGAYRSPDARGATFMVMTDVRWAQ